jgi:spore maturation protein SpmB
MPQIIKHRRGSLESLPSITSSLQRGELVIASGSTNLTASNGNSITFVAPTDGTIQATNRIIRGTTAPNVFPGSTYGGMLNGVPFYASSSTQLPTLFLLNQDGNESINLVGNIQPYSSSVAAQIANLSSSVGTGNVGASVTSLNAYTASAEQKFAAIGLVTSSLNAYTQSNDTVNTNQNNRLSRLEESTASLNAFSASENTKASTLATYTGSIDTKFTAVAASTASLNTFSASVNGHIADINSKTGSYARTNSTNTFNGNQIISGALFVTQDLVVLGSSSIQNISSSNLVIGAAFITLNTFTPASRFAGINILDSGSAGISGSFLYDSVQDEFIQVHRGNGTNVTSSHFVQGPQTYDNLGNELYLTNNRLTKGTGLEHIVDSNITDDGTTISLGTSTFVTGSVTASAFLGVIRATNGVVSGSSQVDITATTNFTTYSSSVSASLAAINANVGAGVGISITNLNAFTASQIDKNATLATYTGSVNSRLSNLEIASASAISRLDQLSTDSGSQNTRITTLETKATTLGTYTASVDAKFVSIGASTSSLNTYTQSVNLVLARIQESTASLNLFTQSANTYFGNNDVTNSTQNTRLSALETATGSNSVISQSIFFINNYTGSAFLSQSVVNARLTALEIASSSLEFFTSSQITKNSTLATYTGSIDTKWSSLAIYTGSIDTKFAAVQSSTSSLNLFTSSILTALTASGVNLTANGNLTVQGNLTVGGTQTIVNSTTIQLGDNILELNGTGVANGGIYVKDPTAPTTGTGSFLWNSTGDFWIAGLSGSEQRILVVGSMGVVSGSAQISLAGTSDYTSLFTGIASATASLNTFSASQNTKNSTLATYTGSIDSKFTTLGTYTGSIDTKFTAVAASTASLNTFTASLSSTSQVTFGGVTSSFNIAAASVSGSTTTKRIAFRDTNGKLELVPSASVNGDFVQWDGGSFIMSNIIDGGSF